MKKILILTALVLALGAVTAMADDGEGLAAPARGTAERVAYDAADAQYQKDDGNTAYHLQAIKLEEGDTALDDSVTFDVDFYSGEDGAYHYRVELKKDGNKWVADKTSSIR
jgi:hypothetical protein